MALLLRWLKFGCLAANICEFGIIFPAEEEILLLSRKKGKALQLKRQLNQQTLYVGG